MAIVGHHPDTGVRVVIERPHGGEPPWCYAGRATTHEALFRLAVRLDADGDVAIELQPGAPAGLADKVRLIVRAAWKHASEDLTAPPRRLVRWRTDW